MSAKQSQWDKRLMQRWREEQQKKEREKIQIARLLDTQWTGQEVVDARAFGGMGVGVFSGAGEVSGSFWDLDVGIPMAMRGEPQAGRFAVGDPVLVIPVSLEEVKRKEKPTLDAAALSSWSVDGAMRKHMGHPGVVSQVSGGMVRVDFLGDFWAYLAEDLEPLCEHDGNTPLYWILRAIKIAQREYGFGDVVPDLSAQEEKWFVEKLLSHQMED